MKKLRFGIIGAGSRGINSFGKQTVANPNECELVALADPNRPRMEAAARLLGVECDLHEQPEELLARDDLDAVFITTPDYLHEKYAVMALEGGKNVFIDKPLATTVKGCLRILQAAREAERLLYMGFNMRFDPVVQRLKQIVSDGDLGEVFCIYGQDFYSGGKTYMARWNRFRKFSGGLFVHKGSHDFDVINWLMNAKPVRVSAFANVSVLKPEGLPFELKEGEEYGPRCAVCPQRERCPDRREAPPEMFGEEAIAADGYMKDTCIYQSEKDTHDQGVAIVEYENGQTAFHGECFVTGISNRLFTVMGDRATAFADLHRNEIKVHPRWGADLVTHSIARGKGGHGGADPMMFRNFVDCLRGKATPLSDVVDGLWAVAIGEAAEISRAEKRVVEIKELIGSDTGLLR